MKHACRMAAFAVVAALATAPALAQEDGAYSWFTGQDEGESSLIYGNLESGEDNGLTFTCTKGSGTATIFVSETSETFKPEQKVSLVLSIGATKATLDAKTTPNEMAGIPSAEASVPTANPIFAAMTDSETLMVAVDAWNTKIPLKGIGAKAAEFAKGCSTK